jgi:hypothetical protein
MSSENRRQHWKHDHLGHPCNGTLNTNCTFLLCMFQESAHNSHFPGSATVPGHSHPQPSAPTSIPTPFTVPSLYFLFPFAFVNPPLIILDSWFCSCFLMFPSECLYNVACLPWTQIVDYVLYRTSCDLIPSKLILSMS